MTSHPSIDPAAIETSLAELWRSEHQDGKSPLTRAALWNVVAHTSTQAEEERARSVLSGVAAAVPQRSIILRSQRTGEDAIAAWVSANCHLAGGEKQVCSEEIVVVATGEAADRVPPLVNALLIPDMPVALWWIGAPSGHSRYFESLLEPAHRLIADSARFASIDDLLRLREMTERNGAALADLNWMRLQQWREATAALFDPPEMRDRLSQIREIRTRGMDEWQALLYAAWLVAQAALDPARTAVQIDADPATTVDIVFEEGPPASLFLGDGHPVIVGSCAAGVGCATAAPYRGEGELLARLLMRSAVDSVFHRTLSTIPVLRR